MLHPRRAFTFFRGSEKRWQRKSVFRGSEKRWQRKSVKARRGSNMCCVRKPRKVAGTHDQRSGLGGGAGSADAWDTNIQ